MKKTICLFLTLVMINAPIPSKAGQPTISICSDHYGNIFVFNTKLQQVSKFDPKYNFDTTVIGSSQLSEMTNITVCWCAGEISTISSTNGSSKLFEYESKTSYKFMRAVAPTGTGIGQIKNPIDICYLRSDDDYWLSIVDGAAKKVVVIDDLGKLNKEVTGLVSPKASYFSSIKKLYICDEGQIKTVGVSDKKPTGSFGKGFLTNPIAIDASEKEDKFFVLDGGNLKSFNSSGTFLKDFGMIPEAVSMTVNISANEVVVASEAEGGSLYVFTNDGKQTHLIKNVQNPQKQVVLKFYVGKYYYHVGTAGFPLNCPVRIENGRSLVPVRQVVEPLGGTIAWDSKTQKITIGYSNPKRIELKIGDPYAYVDGKKTLMPSSVPPRIFCGGTTMVPLKFVSDVLGATTNYYQDSKMIEVKK